MERHEYEKLIEMIKKLEKVTAWRTYFGNKTTIFNNEEVKMADLIEEIKKADSFEKLDEKFKTYDEWVDDINKATTNMQQFVKFNANMNEEDPNAVKEDEIEADKNFFATAAKTMAKARKDSWKNSSEFDKMEKNLEKVNKIINGEIEVAESERDKILYEALENLEKATDKYLEHKVKRGINENAVSKVNAATDMKDYIKERKAEIFRRQIANETNSEIERKKSITNCSEYDKKAFEIVNTQKHIIEIADKLKIGTAQKEEMKKIFEQAEYLTYCGDQKFKENYTKDYNMKEHVESLIAAEFMREELINGGGEVTSVMKKFFKAPEAFAKMMNEHVIGAAKEYYSNDKINVENIKKFVSQDPVTNINEISSKCLKFKDKKFFDWAFSNTMFAIEDTKKEIERQNAEKAERERISLENLKQQEEQKAKVKARLDKYNENLNLARSWDRLAKYTKEHLHGEKGKELFEKSAKYAKKYQAKVMFGDNEINTAKEKSLCFCK